MVYGRQDVRSPLKTAASVLGSMCFRGSWPALSWGSPGKPVERPAYKKLRFPGNRHPSESSEKQNMEFQLKCNTSLGD